ncbi:MAG TPA: sugar phosphate isomerase/epimerase family protein [Armatimonadota bacterium]|nr:sugar phosphate isomerase/epimerase family protein [Armatimonadota bacterium]
MPQNIIAVNTGSYGKFREGAFAHLQSIGVRHVEIPVPAPDAREEVAQRLREHGLSATSMTCPCDLSADLETMREKLEVGRAMGVPLFFISAKAGEMPKPEAYTRLRARAELADEYGITLSMETHPDLGENAGEARATLHAVSHPRLRWNLDTANLYYYNQNINAVEQAQRGQDLIASVHLKDTNGGYKSWWFPALGEGIVDFAGVFRVLNDTGFSGPFTFELEGIQGETLDEVATGARVARSLEHLQALGVA